MKAIPKKTSEEILAEREVIHQAQKHLCFHLKCLENEIKDYEVNGKILCHKEEHEDYGFYYSDTIQNIDKWDEDEVSKYKGLLLARDVLLTAIEGQ